jgi:hypothetical protein
MAENQRAISGQQAGFVLDADSPQSREQTDGPDWVSAARRQSLGMVNSFISQCRFNKTTKVVAKKTRAAAAAFGPVLLSFTGALSSQMHGQAHAI